MPGQPRIGRERALRPPPLRQPAPPAHPGGMRLGGGPPRRLPQIPLPPARHEMGRLPQPDRQEESDHRRRPRDDRDHLARPGHRQTLPGARRRLLHQPPGPRTNNPPPDRQTRSPRPPGQPPASSLTRHPPPTPDPVITGQGSLPPAQLLTIHHYAAI